MNFERRVDGSSASGTESRVTEPVSVAEQGRFAVAQDHQESPVETSREEDTTLDAETLETKAETEAETDQLSTENEGHTLAESMAQLEEHRAGQLEDLKAEMTGTETAQGSPEEIAARIQELDAKADEYEQVLRYQHLVGIRDSERRHAEQQRMASEQLGMRGYDAYSDAQLEQMIAADEAKQKTMGSSLRNSFLVRKIGGWLSGRPAASMSTSEVTQPSAMRTELQLRAQRRGEEAARDEEISRLERVLDGMPHAAAAKMEDGTYSSQSLGTAYRFSGGFAQARHRADSLRQQVAERQEQAAV